MSRRAKRKLKNKLIKGLNVTVFMYYFLFTEMSKERGFKMPPDKWGSFADTEVKERLVTLKRRSNIDELERDIEAEISPKTPKDDKLCSASMQSS